MSSIDYQAELTRAGANIDGVWGRIRFFVRRYPLGALGAVIMAAFVLVAIFADVIALYDPLSTNAPLSLAKPSASHWLGADFMGRDVFSRLVYGARISLAVGLGATFLGCLFGTALGLISGYLGGWVDLLVQRLVDMLQALPLLVLALVTAAALGPSLENTIIAIAIPLMPSVARVIRANTLALRELPFIEAARATGMSDPPYPPQRARAADRARDRTARLDDPGRSFALVPRPRHSGATSVVGPHAVGVRG